MTKQFFGARFWLARYWRSRYWGASVNSGQPLEVQSVQAVDYGVSALQAGGYTDAVVQVGQSGATAVQAGG